MMEQPTAEQSVTEQLQALAQEVTIGENIIHSDSGHLTVEVDPALPEAELIAKNLVACFEDPTSFIDRKDSSLAPEFTGSDDEQWAHEIAWQLYPSAVVRAGSVSLEIQQQRQQRVIEAILQNRLLEIDLGTLWIGHITPQEISLADLAIANNIVGLMKILNHYHQLGQHLSAHFNLQIAFEPSLPPTDQNPATLSTYQQQLSALIQTQADQHHIDLDAIKINLSVLDTATTETKSTQELDPTHLSAQLQQFWIESEQLFDGVLATKRAETNNPHLSWQDITSRSTWSDLKIIRQDEVDKDYQVFVRTYLNLFGQRTLAKLDSFQELPPNIREILGWLSPNFKEALLRRVATFSKLADAESPYEELKKNQELVTLATQVLAQKLRFTLKTKERQSTLQFQFGADLPDSPLTDVVPLKYWGNLTVEKDRYKSPWEKPLTICRSQPATPETIIQKPGRTTMDNYGFRLKPVGEKSVAVKTRVQITIGQIRVEVPLHYLPANWYLRLVRQLMKGKND